MGVLTMYGPEWFMRPEANPGPRHVAEAYALRTTGEIIGHRWTVCASAFADEEIARQLLLNPVQAWCLYVASTQSGAPSVAIQPWQEWTDLDATPATSASTLSAHRAVFGERLLQFVLATTRNDSLKSACERALSPRSYPYTSVPLTLEVDNNE